MEALGGMVALSVVLGVAFTGVIVLALVAIVTGRGDPDPDARRIPTLYAATVGFLALFTVLFAGFAAADSLLSAAIDEEEPASFEGSFPDDPFFQFEEGSFEADDGDDAQYAAAVQAALVALAAAAVFVFHRRLLAAGPREDRDAAWRVVQAYLYAVCFVAILTALFTAASALYGVVRIIAPGVTGFGDADIERRQGLVQFLSTGLLAVAAAWIYRLHWEQAKPLEGPGEAPGSNSVPMAPPPPPA